MLHEFPDDFYGEEIRAVALGYIREEANFEGLEQLKQAIQDDIEFARRKVEDSKEAQEWRNSDLLQWKE